MIKHIINEILCAEWIPENQEVINLWVTVTTAMYICIPYKVDIS